MYIYLLVEHQSSVDYMMPYRLLSYMISIWDQYIKDAGKAGIDAENFNRIYREQEEESDMVTYVEKELRRLKKEGWESGLAEGIARGMSRGKAEGEALGKIRGIAEGEAKDKVEGKIEE